MKKSFMCSLICHNGIVGGGLYIENNAITYKTNKLTVDRKYIHLSFESTTTFEEILALKEQMQAEFDSCFGNCVVNIIVEKS